MDTVRAAGYIIYRKVHGNIEFLLLQATSKAHHWNPPKGHLDSGETEEEAAGREVEEEAGLKSCDLLMIPGFKRVVEYSAHNRSKVVTYWLAEMKDPYKEITLSDEHSNYKWLPVHEARKFASYGVIQELLKECHIFIKDKKF